MIPYQKLVEELSKDQKREVSSWMRGISQPVRRKVSNHAMGEDDTIFLPLQHHDEVQHTPVHPEVAGHLAQHGYKIASGQDYKAGYAVDPHNRQTKIGKALQRTGAPTELINKFNNDPHRALKKDDHLMVAVTRDPHHVAAMSTGRGWSSCMDMDEGINKHYLPEELRAGTHVAYLVHKDDKKIEKPIARVALKPFVKTKGEYGGEIDRDEPHTILRPENGSAYGTDNGALHHTVSEWTNTHFPMKSGASYKKHEKVYDDDGKTIIAQPTDGALKEVIKNREHGLDDVLNMAASPKFNEHAYHMARGMFASDKAMRAIVGHKNTPKSVVNDYVSTGLAGLEGKHKQNFAEHFIDRLYWQANKLHPENVGHLLDHAGIEDNVEVHPNFLEQPGLEDRHIDRMLKGTANFGKVAEIPRWKLGAHHISALIDPPHADPDKRQDAMRSMDYSQVNGLKGTLTKEHSNLVADKMLHVSPDDQVGQLHYSRWMGAVKPEHIPLEKLRGLAHSTDDGRGMKSMMWRNVISHPDVTTEDAHKYHETFKIGSSDFRPLDDSKVLKKVVNDVKDPHAMNAILNGTAPHLFNKIPAHEIIGDALAKHHADGHAFAAKLITHPALDLTHSYDGIKPHHYELAKAMLNTKYEPKGDEHDKVMRNIHSSNRMELAKSVMHSRGLSKDQHVEFLNNVVKHAQDEKETSTRTGTGPTYLHDGLSTIITHSARVTGQVHPDHMQHLREYHLQDLKRENIIK